MTHLAHPRVFAVRADPRPVGTEEIRALIVESNDAFAAYNAATDTRLTGIEASVDDALKSIGRLTVGGGGPGGGPSPANPEHVSAFATWMRSGSETAIRAAMSVGSDPDGGYWAPAFISEGITATMFPTSNIRRVARIETIPTGDAFEEPVDKDEAAANWEGETEAPAETATPQLAMMRVPVHEQRAKPKLTQKLLNDANRDIGQWLIDKVSDKFSRQENTAFVVGGGVTQPRGFLDYPTAATADATRAWGTIEHVVTGAAAGFAATAPGDVLYDLSTTIKDEYVAPLDPADPFSGAVWIMNRRTKNVVRKFKDGQDNYLWSMGNVANGQPETLLGFPILTADDMPDIAADSLPIAFGNFRRGYIIVDRQGATLLRDPYTNKPYVLFYTTKRVGGDVTNFETIKILKVST